jgi:ADP-ribose pyrophosphatase YjhB (NUDIX family)
MATPRVAAGALFTDEAGRILLVRPTYKEYWDIPGGYVEPGESPRAACLREIREELGVPLPVGGLLVVDWAPAEGEGDKLLFIFDGGQLGAEQGERIAFRDGELSEWRFVADEELDGYIPARLSRRLRTAASARRSGQPIYAEHGSQAG